MIPGNDFDFDFFAARFFLVALPDFVEPAFFAALLVDFLLVFFLVAIYSPFG